MNTVLILTPEQMCQLVRTGLGESDNGTLVKLEYQSKTTVTEVLWVSEDGDFHVTLTDPGNEPF